MQSGRRAPAMPGRNQWWRLPLMLAFVLVCPNTLLQAASNPTAVCDAARADDLAGVRKLIQEHADVNGPANDGSTALLWAAYHRNTEMAKALVTAGATVDAANHYGVTPLLQASRNGDVETMRVLLDAGADATRWHPEGETPLMAAARTGRVDAVQLLLSHGSFVNAQDPFQEETALMWAAAEGHLEVVKALIAGGADVKATNADGATATIIAIVNDRFDFAKELLDLGADPNDGSLYFAVDMHDATKDMRAHDGSRLQPSHPNKLTSLDLVKALLDLGADVNKPFIGALHSTT